ncbi:bifunctional folylpolyglutamate synthase/dihydrofolate synthase [bacterium]|nr:bifunctional folylpolyglutamate synthase/dihydrofolate synthase [bacterium]
MTYKETLEYLFLLKNKKIKFGLERVRKVLRELGDPQNTLSVIHVAGTNGKGSVTAFVYSVLREAGYKVGVYSSPHLIDFRERIRVNEKWIGKSEIVNLIKKIDSICKHLSIKLTYFEFITIAAFCYFYRKKVDFVVLEVGMGGRLDATNVLSGSLVSIITNIEYEHKDYLGDTLAKIAGEKAGIIKEKGMVITGAKHKSSFERIRKICKTKEARLFCRDNDFRSIRKKEKICLVKRILTYQQFDYQGIFNNYKKIKIRFIGKHQIENALLSLACIEILQHFYNVQINKKQIYKGLYESFWPGRLELLEVPFFKNHKIKILLDGAHNPSAFCALRDALRGQGVIYSKLFVLLGVLKDKETKKMLKILSPLVDKLIITKPFTERALEPKEIYSYAVKFLPEEKIIIGGEVGRDIKMMFREIFLFYNYNKQKRNKFNKIEEDVLILVTGSLYLVGEVKKILEKNRERGGVKQWLV